MQFRDKSKKRVIINITSLIDVLFLLLIFFIVSSTFLEQPGMKLDLPQTTGQEAVRVEGYTLFILSDGSIYLNEEALDLNDLSGRLQEIAPDVEERGLIFKADETTRYGWAVEIMDIIKQSGITKLIIASQPKREE